MTPFTKYDKFIAAIIAAAGEAVALGLFDHKVLAVVIAFAGALGVYTVPNATDNVDIAARLRGHAGATDLVSVLIIIALVIAIICGLKFLGVI